MEGEEAWRRRRGGGGLLSSSRMRQTRGTRCRRRARCCTPTKSASTCTASLRSSTPTKSTCTASLRCSSLLSDVRYRRPIWLHHQDHVEEVTWRRSRGGGGAEEEACPRQHRHLRHLFHRGSMRRSPTASIATAAARRSQAAPQASPSRPRRGCTTRIGHFRASAP